MLLYVSPSILGYFWPASTLLHGLLALAILSLPETDPQILEHWCYADEFTWAKHSERRIWVSNVCVTCNGFREFHTSDRFPYV